MNDSTFPIEYSMLPLQHWGIKSTQYIIYPPHLKPVVTNPFRFVNGLANMGSPVADRLIYDWIDSRIKA